MLPEFRCGRGAGPPLTFLGFDTKNKLRIIYIIQKYRKANWQIGDSSKIINYAEKLQAKLQKLRYSNRAVTILIDNFCVYYCIQFS